MYSRRRFLIGLFVFTQIGSLIRMYSTIHGSKNEKFIKRGWVLQEGDL